MDGPWGNLRGEPRSRLDEAADVVRVFRDQFHIDLVHVEAEDRYLSLLAGASDPEQKRRIIGEAFVESSIDTIAQVFDIRAVVHLVAIACVGQ